MDALRRDPRIVRYPPLIQSAHIGVTAELRLVRNAEGYSWKDSRRNSCILLGMLFGAFGPEYYSVRP